MTQMYLSEQFQYLEVGRIHPELEGMQLTEVAQVTHKVIDVLDSLSQGPHDGSTMLLHFSRSWAQISPVREVGLGLWGGNQHPE